MKPIEEQNYYELLDVAPGATQEEIEAAFSRAMAYYGPDSLATYSLVPPEEARRLVKLVEDAYLTLSDVEARRDYDLELGLLKPDPPAAPAPGPCDGPAASPWLGSNPFDDDEPDEGGLAPAADAPAAAALAAPAFLPPATATAPASAEPAVAPLAPTPTATPAEPDAGAAATATAATVEAAAALPAPEESEDGEDSEGVEALQAEPAPPASAPSPESASPAGVSSPDIVQTPGEPGGQPLAEEPAPATAAPAGSAPPAGVSPPSVAQTAGEPGGPPPAEEPVPALAPAPPRPEAASVLSSEPARASLERSSEEPSAGTGPAADVAEVEEGPGHAAATAGRASETAEGAGPQAASTALVRSLATPVPPPSREAGERAAPEAPAGAGAAASASGSKPPSKSFEVPPDAVFNGELLRRVRESKGVSLRDVSERTRIGLTHLENIEADHYGALPATVYLRGFLMSLARELKLDPLKVAKSYLDLAAKVRQKT